jgi:transcriptional regulator with XRE-family HTH domain/tetratricopeptide (TPR) repeat protein
MFEPNMKLRAARKQMRWSQVTAATKIGVERKTYMRWENGQNYPQFKALDLVCQTFNMTPEELGFVSIPLPVKIVEEISSIIEPMPLSSLSQRTDINTPLQPGFHIAKILTIINGLNEQDLLQGIAQARIDREIEVLSTLLSQQYLSGESSFLKRQAFITIAALPAIQTIHFDTQATHFKIGEFLIQCTASITCCWRLLKYDGLKDANYILHKIVPSLTHLAFQPSRHQQPAAALAAQANMLMSITAKHMLDFIGLKEYGHIAIKCGQAARDNVLIALALLYLHDAYLLSNKIDGVQKALEVVLKAFRILDKKETLLRSNIAIVLADLYARSGDEKKALDYIALAQNWFLANPEHDPGFIAVDYGLHSLYQGEGETYFKLAQFYPHQGYYQKAWDIFAQSRKTQLVSERTTSETIIYQADAAQRLGDLQAYVDLLREGALLALRINSLKRYNEAVEVFNNIPVKWRKEQKIKVLEQDIFNIERL